MQREAGLLEELSAYHNPRYGDFSTLLEMTFDDARSRFADGSIDLLHLDGEHTYESVRHDFETWRSALSSRAVVLFHDTMARHEPFGVWRLWTELSAEYPAFEFQHSYGLGVLGIGPNLPATLQKLLAMTDDAQAAPRVRTLFAARGDAHVARLRAATAWHDATVEARTAHEAAIEALQSELRETKGELLRTHAEAQFHGETAQKFREALQRTQVRSLALMADQAKLALLDRLCASQSKQLASQSKQLASQSNQLHERDAQLAEAEARLALLYASHSWHDLGADAQAVYARQALRLLGSGGIRGAVGTKQSHQ
jgi:hypothetical protein